MKIVCEKEKLLKAINSVVKGVASKTTMPILEGILIQTNENQIKLSSPLCEGLCNLGSWLAFSTIKSSKTPYFLKTIKENPDPVYGDGFRYVYSKYETEGWEGVLQLARSGKL